MAVVMINNNDKATNNTILYCQLYMSPHLSLRTALEINSLVYWLRGKTALKSDSLVSDYFSDAFI